MRTIPPGPPPHSTQSRRRTRHARSHALMTRIAVTLSLVFVLGMVISHISRPAPAPPATGPQSPVR